MSYTPDDVDLDLAARFAPTLAETAQLLRDPDSYFSTVPWANGIWPRKRSDYFGKVSKRDRKIRAFQAHDLDLSALRGMRRLGKLEQHRGLIELYSLERPRLAEELQALVNRHQQGAQ
jgi:hypothetical protein